MITPLLFLFFFFFNDTATTEIYTLSLHDALPISIQGVYCGHHSSVELWADIVRIGQDLVDIVRRDEGDRRAISTRSDRKSTRLNSSHQIISYAVFCLKKKKKSQRKTHS